LKRKFHSGKLKVKKPVYPGVFDEYCEIVVQYGYVTLFAAAFPLAPLLAILNDIIEVRTDAFKLLSAYNRPEYKGAKNIGTWFQILEILGVIAVMTNCLLIGFTFARVPAIFSKNPFHTLACIVILEHIILFLKFLISILIPDYPGWIVKELAKQTYIREEQIKLMKHKKVQKRTFNYAQKEGAKDEDIDIGEGDSSTPAENKDNTATTVKMDND